VSPPASTGPALSIVVPVHDEAASLPVLHEELREVLDGIGLAAEIVFVDDGSADGSAALVRGLRARDPRVRLVRLRRHAGLTAALDAGFLAARGAVVVTLDGDLQNDPRDIPRLLAALEHADAAVGWRCVRRDPWLRRASSRVANAVRNVVAGDRFRDGGCGLRAIRRHCLHDLPSFRGSHRFLPTLLGAAGHRVVEVAVHHRPRRFGRSHFGVRNRALPALHDLLAVRWLVARRLAYDTVEEAAPPAPAAPARPARAAGSRTAIRLAAFWLAAAVLLGGWGLLAGRPPARDVPGGTSAVTLFARPPTGRVVALWLRWDAAPGNTGWAIIEGAGAWSASAEMSWRRRIHPGWNHLIWPDLAGLPADEPVRLRLADAAGAGWQIASPAVDARYGLHHLTQLRGLLMALALAAVVAVASVVARVRHGPWPRVERWGLALAGVTALALWLRAYTLSLQSLWFDEVLTAIGAQNLAWVTYTPQIFGHPPLQYLVALAAGGQAADEWWLRLPSLAAGVATVVALADLGRRLHGPATGLLAALALSVSPFHVEISQLARPYALLVLLTVLSLGALVRALDRQRARDWLWFSALLALSLYTHYLALQVLALQALTAAVLLARGRWRGARSALLSFAGAVVLLLPWLPVLRRLGRAQLGQGELPAALLHELVTRVFVAQFLGRGAGTLIGLALVAWALCRLRRRPDLAGVALLWLALPLVVLWAAQPAHFVAGRHLAFMLPIVMLLVGHGLAAVADAGARAIRRLGGPGRALPQLGAALAAGLVLVAWGTPAAEGLRDYYQGRAGADWRTVASVLDRLIPPEDRVLATVGAVYPLRYYWSSRVEELVVTALPGPPPGRPGRRWLVTHEGRDRPPGLSEWLAAHAVKVGEVPASWSLPGLEIHRLRP
jgi:4-amino-4-deoxy-L-arabinose transferase-like glycosyltransferase